LDEDGLNCVRNIDWDRLYKVLVVQATVCLRHYRGPDTFDGGHDREDVCAEVLKEFYGSADALGWKESKGKFETYLGRIVHNKLVDRLRRQKHVRVNCPLARLFKRAAKIPCVPAQCDTGELSHPDPFKRAAKLDGFTPCTVALSVVLSHRPANKLPETNNK
jgi:hypothetical protein